MNTDARKELWKQAFGDTDAFVDGFFATGFHPERCLALEQDGRLAAALYWFDCTCAGHKVAYIYGVATEKDFRGQGLCRKLMQQAHSRLEKGGYAGAVLVPADAGLTQMYEKMGYRSFCPVEMRKVLAGSQAVKIQKITTEEYDTARQKRLPDGGILHSKDALAFYETYGGFYRFAGGVFCAARESDTLYIQEYLADPAALPGIAAAFACNLAQVRLPGGSQVFAMYRSFTSEEILPTYFGIALD